MYGMAGACLQQTRTVVGAINTDLQRASVST